MPAAPPSRFAGNDAAVGPAGAGWRIRLAAPAAAVDIFSRALRPFSLSVSASGDTAQGDWTIDAYAVAPPDVAHLSAAMALAAAAAGLPEPAIDSAPLGRTDWLTENLHSFQPVRAGRFFVYPSHHDAGSPPGCVPICVDAAIAFGSGEHGSTRGCLLTLDRLAPLGRPSRALDLGCGSGILSIAMAKLWRSPVTAADIDPDSVRVSRENVVRNGVVCAVRVARSDGLTSGSIRASAPFDVIVANILARPLMRMARDLTAALSPRGVAILSGLLVEQECQVLGAYRRCGLALAGRCTVEGWRTLILRR